MGNDIATTINADDLVPEIVSAHEAVIDHFQQSVACAIKAGELLIQAKSLVRRGEWQDWLANNCPFAETTAQGYMRLAKLPEENRNAVADLSLRAALAAIASTREKQIADESKTIDEEAEEVEPSESDEVLEQRLDDTPTEEEEAGRSPEQKARDIASEVIHDVIQRCQWKNINHLLAFQTIIKLLTEELKAPVIPLSAEDSAEARKAAHTAAEAEDEAPAPVEPPKKKGGRPPKHATASIQSQAADWLSPLATDDLSIPDHLKRATS